MPDPTRLCEVDDCLRPAHSGGRHCAGHAKRLERGARLAEPLREKTSLRERVLRLAINLADADSEDDKAYERAWDALEHAVTDWADSIRGRRGAKARSDSLTSERRAQIARQAAAARWKRAGKHAGRAGKGKRRPFEGG